MESLQLWENKIRDFEKKVADILSLKWKFCQGIENGEAPDIDDSQWEEKHKTSWIAKNGVAYFRTLFIVPESIEGIALDGSDIDLEILFPSGVTVFIDGKMVYSSDFWADMRAFAYPLFKNASPGKKHLIVFKTPQGDGLSAFWAKIKVNRIEDILFELNSITYQLKFAIELAKKEKRLKKHVEKALALLSLKHIDNRKWDEVLKNIKEMEECLEPFRKVAKKFSVHLIGHAHIDMNWLWTYDDTVKTCLRDFRTVTQLMDKYPELTFSQSQTHIYKIVEEHDPALFEKVKEKIKKSKWDVTASSWVENDLNMVNGESIIRHILYSKKYTTEKLGVDTEVFWAPDTFGHPETIPSILTSAGLRYYYFMRCGKGYPLMRWQSKNGDELIAFSSVYNNSINPRTLMPLFIDYYIKYGIPDFLFVYGVGDHGGGPAEIDIKRKQQMDIKPVFPKLKFSTTKNFFKAIEKFRKKIPAISGELNSIFEGCYTTHSDIKKYNRECENLLLALETLLALVHINGKEIPESEIEELWQFTLFNQFHDIIDGSAIHSSYEYSSRLANTVKIKAESLLKKQLSSLVTQTVKDSIVVFNPLGWERSHIINGQLIRNIPGYGYKTIEIKEKKETKEQITKWSVYENEFYRITLDEKKGLIRKLYDKINKRDVLSPLPSVPEDPSSWWAEKSGNLVSIFWEEPHPMSAWIIGNIYRIENLLKADEIKAEADGVKTTILIKRSYRNSKLIQKMIFYNELPFIDFENEIVWNEEGNENEGVPMLRVNFHTALKNPETYFEIPFGAVRRDVTGKEYPALRWAGQREKNYWVVLMNTGKYGYNIDGNNLSLTLLRNPYEPDSHPDRGEHTVSCRLFFGVTTPTAITKMAMEYNMPPVIMSGKAERKMFYPFTIEGEILPVCFKKTLDRNSCTLRLVEMDGRRKNVKIEFVDKPKKLHITNSIEERKQQKPELLKGNILSLRIMPYEILTMEIEL